MTAASSLSVSSPSASAPAKSPLRGLRTFASDVAEGFFEITHNGFAFIGVVLVIATAVFLSRPDLRDAAEQRLGAWLESRKPPPEATALEPEAILRTTAARPQELPRPQAAVAYWLSRKYRVAPEPLSVLVAEAYEVGAKVKLDPTLILAIMAVESSFNPFAQSTVGAQGLMQVMTRVHGEKYESAGGVLTAFDPVTNLRVGVKVLQECIARAGSIEGGLKYYVGAANLPTDGGYAAKVLAERERLLRVARGQALPTLPSASPAQPIPVVAPAAPEPTAQRVALVSAS